MPLTLKFAGFVEDEIQAYWSTSSMYSDLCKDYKEIKGIREAYEKFRKDSK